MAPDIEDNLPVPLIKFWISPLPTGSSKPSGPLPRLPNHSLPTSHRMVIYNVGIPGANAYENTNVITAPGTRIDINTAGAGIDQVQLSPPFRFAFDSPQRRLFLVDSAITYLCDVNSNTITRFSGYAVAANQLDRDSAAELLGAGGSAALMANDIESCSFTYLSGTAERAGLVTVSLTVSDQGERVSLLRQVHVDNVP